MSPEQTGRNVLHNTMVIGLSKLMQHSQRCRLHPASMNALQPNEIGCFLFLLRWKLFEVFLLLCWLFWRRVDDPIRQFYLKVLRSPTLDFYTNLDLNSFWLYYKTCLFKHYSPHPVYPFTKCFQGKLISIHRFRNSLDWELNLIGMQF